MGIVISLEQAIGEGGIRKHWAYNCVDCVGTRRIADKLLPRLEGNKVYAFERALQNPYFAMMRRGILIDPVYRDKVMRELEGDIATALAEAANDPSVLHVWDQTEKETGTCPKPARKDKKHKWEPWEKGKPENGRACIACRAARLKLSPYNANSSTQTMHLFYDLFGVKKERNKKGEISADEEVLERIGRKYARYTDLTKKILRVRDLKKQYGFVKSKLSPAGRWLSSANVGTAWTGRSSSSKNPMGFGNNTQNVAERVRRMFIADPGYEMFYADLKQAESMVVAYLAEDQAYIEAHLMGDVHTYVTRVIWPDEMAWTGDLARDKKLAAGTNPPWDQAPGHNYRFQAKRNTHGYPYGISPTGTARIVHISQENAEHAHGQLDKAFPNIKLVYHPRVRERVVNQQPIVTQVGREILLFGRPWDPATWRQGYSAEPQSLVADLVNIALFRIWKEHDPHLIQVLANGYDAILGQCPIGKRDEAVKAIVEAMAIPVEINGRVMVIPVEISFGNNWGKASEDNPNGQKEIKL